LLRGLHTTYFSAFSNQCTLLSGARVARVRGKGLRLQMTDKMRTGKIRRDAKGGGK